LNLTEVSTSQINTGCRTAILGISNDGYGPRSRPL